jgi:hypothetical protein
MPRAFKPVIKRVDWTNHITNRIPIRKGPAQSYPAEPKGVGRAGRHSDRRPSCCIGLCIQFGIQSSVCSKRFVDSKTNGDASDPVTRYEGFVAGE